MGINLPPPPANAQAAQQDLQQFDGKAVGALTAQQQAEIAVDISVITQGTPGDTVVTAAQAQAQLGQLDPTTIISPDVLSNLEADTPQVYPPPIKKVNPPTSPPPNPTFTLAGFFSSAMATVSIAMNNLASLLTKIQEQMDLQSASLTPQLVQTAHDIGDAAKDKDDMQAFQALGSLISSAVGLAVSVGSLGFGIAKGAFGRANIEEGATPEETKLAQDQAKMASDQGQSIISTGNSLSQSITGIGTSASQIWTDQQMGVDDLQTALAQNTQSITSKVQDQLSQAANDMAQALQQIFAQLRAQADGNASRGIFQGV